MNWAKTAGFILLAYIVFTTGKGNLRRWLQIIGLKPDGPGPDNGKGSIFDFGQDLSTPAHPVDLRGKS